MSCHNRQVRLALPAVTIAVFACRTMMLAASVPVSDLVHRWHNLELLLHVGVAWAATLASADVTTIAKL